MPYQAFLASDGEFVLAIASEKLWRLACHALQRPEWVEHPDYRDNSSRVRHRIALCGSLATIFSQQPTQHWLDLFTAAGVPAAPIRSVSQALHAPLTEARGMTLTLGGVPMVASPLNLSATPVHYRDPPPKLGQHSDEIVRRVGGDPVALRAAGAIR